MERSVISESASNINKFIRAMETNDSYTNNGMVTNSTTSNYCLNLFFTIGAMRSSDVGVIHNTFYSAYNENPKLAIKILFWVRDIRFGAGERRIFREILYWLSKYDIDVVIKNLKYVPEYGRWDDLLFLYEKSDDSRLKLNIITIIYDALFVNTNALCAKWMPRKGELAAKLRNDLANISSDSLTPRKYRKKLVELTDVVETKMCNKDWKSINYSHVPSVAMSRYKGAFCKHDLEGIAQFLKDLINKKSGVKINAGAVFPHDIVRSILSRNEETNIDVAEEQWKSLPDWIGNSKTNFLPIVDVSGSMTIGDISGSITPLMIAISLGLYFSERNKSVFKDCFITFSDNPQFVRLSGSLFNRITQMSKSNWEMNTDLDAVFNLILNKSIKENVPQEDMPTHLIILSDMEFDGAATDSDFTAYDMIKEKYETAGYTLPNIVFWNINKSSNNFPLKYDERGTALISGYSPSIIKSILEGSLSTPMEIMLNTILVDRYEQISI